MNKKISIVIPWHFMDNWQFFLNRCLKSIEKQTFKDYEIILMKVDTMPNTTNRGIEAAQGELVKILFMDDYFAHENSLKEIVLEFDHNLKPEYVSRSALKKQEVYAEHEYEPEVHWLVTSCLHDYGTGIPKNYHTPSWNDQMYTGVNTIGSPSVLTFKREGCLLFDNNLSWLLDCELYHRLYQKFGPPKIVDKPNVVIGIHSGQTSVLMPDSEKILENQYVQKKYESNTDF